MPISKTQIDRLGNRLKDGQHTESDLRLLDDYRRSFADACETVMCAMRKLGESPTARLTKSTLSITEKLRRESIRLSQMQDIAGCRIVVPNIIRQDEFVASVVSAFPEASVIDRRLNPSYGYRAVHIVVEAAGKSVEIQVRSALQHLWAEVSEKSSDVLDSTVKYGGGPEKWRTLLATVSESVAAYEGFEKHLFEFVTALEKAATVNPETYKKSLKDLIGFEIQKFQHNLNFSIREGDTLKEVIEKCGVELAQLKESITNVLSDVLSRLDELKRLKNDIPH